MSAASVTPHAIFTIPSANLLIESRFKTLVPPHGGSVSSYGSLFHHFVTYVCSGLHAAPMREVRLDSGVGDGPFQTRSQIWCFVALSSAVLSSRDCRLSGVRSVRPTTPSQMRFFSALLMGAGSRMVKSWSPYRFQYAGSRRSCCPCGMEVDVSCGWSCSGAMP